MRYITKLDKMENMPLDIDDNLLEGIKTISDDTGNTQEEVIRHIITDVVTEPIDVDKFSKDPEKYVEKYASIFLMKDGKPFARVQKVEPFKEIDEKKIKD